MDIDSDAMIKGDKVRANSPPLQKSQLLNNEEEHDEGAKELQSPQRGAETDYRHKLKALGLGELIQEMGLLKWHLTFVKNESLLERLDLVERELFSRTKRSSRAKTI